MKNFGGLFGRWHSPAARSQAKVTRSKRRARTLQSAAPEQLEQRLLMATDLYFQRDSLNNTEHGWAVFVQNEAGDDLYIRETTGTDAFGTVSPRFQYSNNADFSNSEALGPTSAEFRDVLVTDGVPQDVSLSSTGSFFFLPGADDLELPSTLTPALFTFDTPSYDYVSGHVVPGTFSGQLSLLGPFASFSIRTQYLFDHFDGIVGNGVPLLFRDVDDVWKTSRTFPVGDETWTIDEGRLNYRTGLVTYRVLNPDGVVFSPDADLDAAYSSPVRSSLPSTVALTPGLDFGSGFYGAPTGPDTLISIESPIASGHAVSLRATNVVIDASITTRTEGLSSFLVAAETATFAAPVQSPEVSFFIADDPRTSAVNRGSLLISSIGSVTGVGGGLASNIVLEARDSDVRIEGALAGFTQSYRYETVTSPVSGVFTTTTTIGQPSGSIVGNAVDILLTNTTAVEPADSLSHLVSLDTNIASLRLAAANTSADGMVSATVTAIAQTTSPFFPPSADVVVDDTTGIGVGDVVVADAFSSIPSGTTVDSIDPATRTITFSSPVFVRAGSELRFLKTVIGDVTDSTVIEVGDVAGIELGDVVAELVTGGGPASGIPENTYVVAIDPGSNEITLSQAVTLDDGAAIELYRFRSAYKPFNYDVRIREANDLAIDASLTSGGPVSIAAAGALAVNATVNSEQQVSFTSGAGLTGNAWLTSVEGGLSIDATDVNLRGRLQVLAAPFDDSLTDIEILARNGSIRLDGGATAVNQISLEQRGAGGVVARNPIVTESLDILATGVVTLQTNVRYAEIETGGAVTVIEADDAELTVTTPGAVNLTALGSDPIDGTRAALEAELRQTTNVVLTAPAGSIDVAALTAEDLTMGNATALLTGLAPSMQAAGSVSIRSSQGGIVALDAPLAGVSQLEARAVSSMTGIGNLPGTYAQNVPGQTPATLTGIGNGSLNNVINFQVIFPGFRPATDASPNPLRVRDIVLLRGQDAGNENGLYQITSLGSPTTPWVLTRTAFTETTAEFGLGTRVTATDGDFAGDSFRVDAYANVLDSTPLRATAGLRRSIDEVSVRLATDTVLDGTFDSATSTITGTLPTLLVNGIVVKDGDLVLVRYGATDANDGTVPSTPANGVFKFVASDPTTTDPWRLERYHYDNDPLKPIVEETVVIVQEGFYRTVLTGESFTVAYDGLGLVDVSINEAGFTSEIGSYDPRDLTTFVVSTAGSTNQDAGSFGKMLSLIQANEARHFGDEPVEQTVRFGNVLGSVTGPTGTIRLQQELPTIDKPFTISVSNRFALSSDPSAVIVLDGSRITATRENTFVGLNTVVNGLEYTAGASTVPLPTPEEAVQSRLSGVQLAGFEQGGAVVVDGTSNLLIENLTIGRDGNGVSKPGLNGIVVTGTAGVNGPVSLVNNTVAASSVFGAIGGGQALIGSGVLIEGQAQYVQIVGGTLGGSIGSNTTGVTVQSTNTNLMRPNSIGVNPLSAVQLRTTANRASLTIPAENWNVIGNDVYVGQTVSGNGIASGSRIIAIDHAARTVILSERMTSSVASSRVTFGTPNRTNIVDNFYGVQLKSGNTRMANTTVSNNVLDGIVIGTALPDAIWAQIGAGIALDAAGQPDPKIRTSASNAIFSNGRYGIRFGSGITSQTASPSTVFPFAPVPTVITIQGNYVGTNTSGASGLNNGRSSYFWDATGSSSIPPDGSAGTGTGFDSLITSLDPDGPNPALDNGNGNINADLAPTTGGGGGGGGGGGSIPTPPRR